MSRLAVVLFNLGGPDRPEAVEPFLFNLFNDGAIIGAPRPVRWLLAKWIARRRAPVARAIYDRIGGRSPLVPQTEAQARALEAALGPETKAFLAMRYWHPDSGEAAAAVKAFAPDRIVLLPLYPQYSTTTTGSSLAAWHAEARRAGITAPTTAVCCYPTETGWIASLAERTRAGLAQASMAGRPPPRVLFSAHGLPERVIARGDPYRQQVERTAAAAVQALAMPGLDWLVCYQSRVGPLKWIGPATEAELRRAGADGVPVVVVPAAFVSEHSETLVELDIEYRHLAMEAGVPAYVRAPTVGTEPVFIAGLAGLVRRAAAGSGLIGESAGPCGPVCCPRTSG